LGNEEDKDSKEGYKQHSRPGEPPVTFLGAFFVLSDLGLPSEFEQGDRLV